MEIEIAPTGNPWIVESQENATVVIATDAMKFKVYGAYRQRERKLFALIVHAIWDELKTVKRHTLLVYEISRIFSEVTGSKNQKWIWEYFLSMAEVKISYKSQKLEGVFRLFSALQIDKEKGTITFEIPEELIDILLAPTQWARLRTHFMIGLEGKYSVSLYQFLESKINLQQVSTKGFIDVSLDELKDWLALGGDYKRWIHFRDRVLNPAVEAINSNHNGATFHIKTDVIRGKRKKVIGVRFYLTKNFKRVSFENNIKESKEKKLDTSLYELVPQIPQYQINNIVDKFAYGWDAKIIEKQWRTKIKKDGEKPNNALGSFTAYCKKVGRHKDYRTY